MNTSVISQQVIGFGQFLKAHDFQVGVSEISDSLLLLEQLDEPDKSLTKHYFRSLFCNNNDQWQRFHELFDRYWCNSELKEFIPARSKQTQPRINAKLSGLAGSTQAISPTDKNANCGIGAGKQNTIGKADFRFLNNPQAMQEVERLAELLANQLKQSIKRKKKIAANGHEINFRHTIRASLPCGSIAAKPRFNLIKREPPSIVILHDVSHSMTWNNPLLFRFVRGLVNAFHQTEAFVFHTKLNHVTDVFKSHSVEAMKQKLEATNNLWLGGTCIALSLETFNKDYAPGMLNKKTSVILISDGFDTDKPEKLIVQLKALKTRAEKVLWLNPMLGRDGYEEDAGTRAARPFVDAMLPAHSLDSLRQVINRLK